jgi:hypothetical protein
MNLLNFIDDEIPTPYSITEDNNIQLVDSFLSEQELSILQSKILNCLQKYTKDEAQGLGYFHTSVGWTGSVCAHWSYIWSNDTFMNKIILNKIQDTLKAKFSVDRIYSAFQSYGQEGTWHVDSGEDPNKVTCTIYLDIYDIHVCNSSQYISNAPYLSRYDINNINYFSYIHDLNRGVEQTNYKEKYNLINKQQLQYSLSHKIINNDNNVEKIEKMEKMEKMKKILNENDCGGYFNIKPPGINHIISIPTITNRLCYFPATYLHLGDSPNNSTQKLRVVLSYKLNKL